MNLPATCSHCGLIFPSAISIDLARNVTLRGNKQTCPRCHKYADIIEGTFNIIDGVITKLNSTDFSKFEKAMLKDMTTKLVNEDISFAVYEDELKKRSVLNEILDLFPKSRKEKLSLVKFTAKVLLALLSLYTTSEMVTININKTEILNEIYYEEQSELEDEVREELIDLEEKGSQDNLIRVDFENKRKQ